MKTPFLGGYGVSRSLNVSDNQLVNLFPEIVETKDGKDVGAFYLAPGLTLKLTLAGGSNFSSGPIRGMAVWTQAGVDYLVVVSGQFVWIVNQSLQAVQCTGVLLALARVAGETAPLLFTALGNLGWAHSLKEPIAAMPLQIFNYAISPYDDWHRQAWAGAFVLLMLVLAVNVGVRFLTRDRLAKPSS